MSLIPPAFLDCVVAIGSPGHDGKPTYIATGFPYGHFIKEVNEHQKQYKIFLVTNRHVFHGERSVVLRFNPKNGASAQEYTVSLLDHSGTATWFAHDDTTIDLAALSISGQFLQAQGINFSLFGSDGHVLRRAKATSLGISEGDGVFVLGFPLGLVGEERNFVIVRHGAIARVRDCLEGKSKTFLIDCSIFPGNSGGPVVTRPESRAMDGTKSSNAAYLLGVVASYMPYRNVTLSQGTRNPSVISEENSGLASVFPVDYIEQVVVKALYSDESTVLAAGYTLTETRRDSGA